MIERWRHRRVALWRATVATAALVGFLGCGSRQPDTPVKGERAPSANRAPAVTPPADSRPRIVALGDSLTAGLGLSAEEAYPALLQQRLNDSALKLQVINAGVSGDTSAGALRRLDWALEGDVRVMIVALGGNDALRGLPVEELDRNLSEIIERAQARKIDVILAGMEAPPNFGRDYTVGFHDVFPALAKRYKVALVPFLLEGVAGIEGLNQRDGIHPTAAGARKVADNLWATLKPLAERRADRK